MLTAFFVHYVRLYKQYVVRFFQLEGLVCFCIKAV
jgi:hypothetical protein